jgi:hypothetical protein
MSLVKRETVTDGSLRLEVGGMALMLQTSNLQRSNVRRVTNDEGRGGLS